MKKIFLLILFAFVISNVHFGQGGVILLEGNYQGKNIYIQNPYAIGGVGFCVTEIIVNGNVTTDETQSSAFEIDFKSLNLKMGDKIEVKIKHKSDCKPKVLNSEVLKPKSTFEVKEILLSNNGTLEWRTTNETGKLPYIIEQFRWNKWVKVGEVEGLGLEEENKYTFKIDLHSGKNQVRVKQTDYSNIPRSSKPAEASSGLCEVEFYPVKASTNINFSCVKDKNVLETMYEVYDQYGTIVKRGYGDKIDVANLSKGGYFLNYDSKMGEFIKR